MKLVAGQGVWGIQADQREVFFINEIIDPEKVYTSRPRPKIIPPLAEWWDSTAPGQWWTGWFDRVPSIYIRDPSLFNLFKLAWAGSDEITLKIGLNDSAAFYCPYIPLTITSATPKINNITFKTVIRDPYSED